MPTKGIETVHVWDMGTTGEAANIAKTLKRYPNSSTETAATETVTVAEIGSTGRYYITYTPLFAQVYTLRVQHSGGASPTYLEHWWEDDVRDAPSTASEADSYASESDVVAFTQMGDYTSTTIPSDTQVVGFLADRASLVYGRLAEIMGSEVTGPSGYDTTIDTTGDAGKALARAARKANAVGAAIDALQAAGVSAGALSSERMQFLNAMWEQALGDLEKPAVAYLGHRGRSRTHISSGHVSVPSVTIHDQQGLVMTPSIEF